MKTLIIYASIHHDNTKKIVDHIKDDIEADIIDITKKKVIDINDYDIIGFASGIYFGNLHKKLMEYIKETSFKKNQRVFVITTCGFAYKNYSNKIKKILLNKEVDWLGSFQCLGYDTFGLLKKIGGIAKKHPNERDLEKSKKFIKFIYNKISQQ